VCEAFDDEQGNVLFSRVEHTWKDGRCISCGASDIKYGEEKRDELEAHAYQFIHANKPMEFFNMKFDVIVGNPPYQLSTGGGIDGHQAVPIYHRFITQAKKMKPRFLSMIVPARWFSGGMGLDDFRNEMLHDDSIRTIHDFPDSTEVFPGVQIKGGVCYFLWDRDNHGLCKVVSHNKNRDISIMERPLLEDGAETFIRFNEGISILNKVRILKEATIKQNISSQNPFGLVSSYNGYSPKPGHGKDVKLYRYGDMGYISKKQVVKNKEMIDKIYVIISKSGSGSDSFPHQILNVPIIAEPLSACTETYIILNVFDDIEKAKNFVSYVKTRLFRFLVLLIKNTQNALKNVYTFVPMQDFSEPWTDEKLYKKYSLAKNEIAFIESMIRPMEMEGESNV
jgi:site-specific DNA-methyltransferase (adenine-specific)